LVLLFTKEQLPDVGKLLKRHAAAVWLLASSPVIRGS
jgi:hypothetical protein